ncbi:Eco57I restriction-modification methylase domain-containing protein [Methanobrevibacter sp.]|uniref:Eco57I restriction-modification methylase domain-containing protein n=1 Tax=Methanobrevibacter sp. TaxID=66852 RepID=UPI0025F57756|nr:N-6 DNA methylase [Methanobrevibacter sp.]MBQ2831805.1 N-6 DNA methylase [Methanobrevibacter sp.]
MSFGSMVNAVLNQENIEKSRAIISELVAKFESNKDIYLSKDYKEEDIKVEFISPMFKALGWDIDNVSGNAPQFKEVIFEESIAVGNKTKNPDYTFQIGGQKIFFLEAKAPHRDLDHDRSPAYQVRRYGWSAKLDLCVLTDFEEFAIYETNTKPNKNQSASIGRVKYYKYSEYADNWEEIYSIFSKEAVLKGLFDKFVDGTEGVKKGTSEVDHEFLKEINRWRELLARNIALRNENISIEGLNYAVQLTIDRILFFRMAEDRGIEKYKTLYNLADEDNIYEKLMSVFKIADAKYNSGLFCLTADPSKHLNRDTVTEDLIIDDKVFKEIFKNLYYPESPYEFSVISPEILGIVYEQFLGSTITLTDGHRARIEQKPAVRKAGGVFYTPQHIVKDIVENTVGKVIKNKSLKQIENIKIIDIACGSGSFILGAYKFLLDHYLNEYLNMKRPPANTIYQGKDGQWRLTISEKKRILKNNIYGVDIDFLAVEVSKLTLLLQVLEDQNKDVVEQQQKLFHERVLPDLSENVKNGNTIIETDYITSNMDIGELNRIKPFNYADEFPKVFENNGFDVIVTNPPYVRQELLSDNEKNYFETHYQVYERSADYYVYFYERAFDILKDNGYFGLICSNKFTKAKYGKKLRKLILDYKLNYYIDYEGVSIFRDVAIVPSVMVMQKSKPNNNRIFVNKDFYLPQSSFTDDIWSFESPDEFDLKEKLFSTGNPLGKLDVAINSGIKTGYNTAFVIKEDVKNELLAKDINNGEIIKPLLRGRDIKKWQMSDNHYIIFTPIGVNIKDYPYIKEHLDNYRKRLKSRSDMGNHYWEFRQCAYYDNIFSEKLVWAEISPEPAFCVDLDNHVVLNSAYLLNSYDDNYPLYYLAGLLNSNVTKWIFKRISPHILAERLRFTKQYVSKIPIVDADMKDKNRIIQLSKDIISYYNSFNSLDSTPAQKKILDTQIKVTEEELNNIIYRIYGLSDEEIAIIDGSYHEGL